VQKKHIQVIGWKSGLPSSPICVEKKHIQGEWLEFGRAFQPDFSNHEENKNKATKWYFNEVF
jgi:hypothetical protein